MAEKTYYPGINGLRGLAAVLVVLQHASPDGFLRMAAGTYGILIFFCISGFVIGLNRHLPTFEFAVRRALRIYPGYWAAYLLSALIVGTIGFRTDWTWWSPLLVPTYGYPAIYIPMWTLVFEVFFYVLATVAFSFRFSDRTLTAIVLGWVVLILMVEPHMQGPISQWPGPMILFAQSNLFFAGGLLCALNLPLLERFTLNHFLIVAVVTLVLIPALPPLNHITTLCAYAVCFSSAVMAASKIAAVPHSLMMLGNSSYGLFLMHLPGIMVAKALVAPYGLPPLTQFGIYILAGLATGLPFGLAEYAAHRAVLRRVLRLLRSDAPRSSDPTSVGPPTSVPQAP